MDTVEFTVREQETLRKGHLRLGSEGVAFTRTRQQVRVTPGSLSVVEVSRQVVNRYLVGGVLGLPGSLLLWLVIDGVAGFAAAKVQATAAGVPAAGLGGIGAFITQAGSTLAVGVGAVGLVLSAALLGLGLLNRGYHIHIGTPSREYTFLTSDEADVQALLRYQSAVTGQSE